MCDAKIIFEDKTYWLMNGSWFLLEREFMEEINNQLNDRVTKEFNLDFTLHQIQGWPEEINEGKFNYIHNEQPSVYVLDKILYENIEMCDLLIKDDNILYFVHVKKGLDGEVRVLTAQLESAMRTLHDGLNNDIKVIEGFYDSVINKIKPDQEDVGVSISKAARKFQMDFPNDNLFIETLRECKIKFVFAYRPLDSHDFNNPKTIGSTAAKLSMIDLTRVIREFDYELEFMRISNTC